MKYRMLFLLGLVILFLAFVGQQLIPDARSQELKSRAASPTPAEIQKKIENYLRFSFALGPTVKLSFGPLTETPVPGLYKVTVNVTTPDSPPDKATFYVSKDGRYLVRAELEDMNADPFAENRKLMNLSNVPSKGPKDAKVVLVEYADYECPSCKQLDTILRTLLSHHPEVRLIYKNFPLTEIHPWAMAAAEAGQCAYEQNPDSFWTFHDLVFDGQGFISETNITQKMEDFATQAGIDPNKLRSCISIPHSKEMVQQSMKEGESLHVAQTPTIFVNGRRLVAPDEATLDQLINYLESSHSANDGLLH